MQNFSIKKIPSLVWMLAVLLVGLVVIIALVASRNQKITNSITLPIELNEFFDYQCTHCIDLAPAIKEAQKRFGDKLVVSPKYFPIFSTDTSSLSYQLSYGAEAAKLQGKLSEYQNLAFEKMLQVRTDGNLGKSGPTPLELATELNLDLEKFNKDIVSEQVIGVVNATIAEGKSKGVSSTPTLYIEGLPAKDIVKSSSNGTKDYSPLYELIERYINQAESNKN